MQKCSNIIICLRRHSSHLTSVVFVHASLISFNQNLQEEDPASFHSIHSIICNPQHKVNYKVLSFLKTPKQILVSFQLQIAYFNCCLKAGRSGTLVCQALCTQLTWVQFQTRAMLFSLKWNSNV